MLQGARKFVKYATRQSDVALEILYKRGTLTDKLCVRQTVAVQHVD